MNYQQFSEALTERLNIELTDQKRVRVQTIIKQNTGRIKTVSLYKGEERCSPYVYLAPFYRMYKSGYTFENLTSEVRNVLEMTGEQFCREDPFISFTRASAFLAARLVNYRKNAEFIKLVPHRRILDLAVVYHLVFNFGEGKMGSAVIYNDHCRIWGVTEDILFQTAVRQMSEKYPPVLKRLEEMLSVPFDISQGKESALYFLSSSSGFFGAAVLLYPGILRQAAEDLGEFYVLPSSVHEVLLMPASGRIPQSELSEAVATINATVLREDEFLSDSVYFYGESGDKVGLKCI